MVLAKKNLEKEQARFREELDRKLHEELSTETVIEVTSFGRNQKAVKEFGRRLLEFKDCGEMIRVNNIGVGLVASGWTLLQMPSEPFELINEARSAGIKPEKILFYVADISQKALFHLKTTKEVTIPIREDTSEHLKNFFPDMQTDKGESMSVRIPDEWMNRMLYLKLDILKQPAPVKAHLTFSYITYLSSDLQYLNNLVASTKRGGYIFCGEATASEEVLKLLNLEPVQSPVINVNNHIYRLK